MLIFLDYLYPHMKCGLSTPNFSGLIGEETAMACVCEICGKRTQTGNTVETRGKAKYLGGVGTKVTGITRRKFKPNLQRVRVSNGKGGTKTAKVCTQCIRSGAVVKVVKHRPFQLTPQQSATAAETA